MLSPIDIGPRLIAARVALGVTQQQLAARLGVRQPQIARWEASEYRNASLARVDAVARALGVALDAPLVLAAEAPALYAESARAESETGARALDRLGVSAETIAAFCRLHGVEGLALFGSVVRKDFGPDSDVDVLVSWRRGKEPVDFGQLADLQAELAGIFRRRVDLVDRRSVENSENYLRKARILEGARSVYVAR